MSFLYILRAVILSTLLARGIVFIKAGSANIAAVAGFCHMFVRVIGIALCATGIIIILAVVTDVNDLVVVVVNRV